MTVVRINAITVPAGSGDELARRFANRAGAVDNQDGFEGFELLKPTDGRNTWLVVTRWRDEEAFEAWRNSPAFGHGHRAESGAQASPHGGHPAGGHPEGGHPEGGHPEGGHTEGGHPEGGHTEGGHPHGGEGQAPVAVSSELWSYDIAGGSAS
jgi:heme oxygenase (mycobilin-producing)